MKFGSFMDKHYKEKIVAQLNIEPVLAKIIREENERKERLIRESLDPWRLWLLDRVKWRWLRRSLTRAYRIEERVYDGHRRLRVYKGKKQLRVEIEELGPEIRFVRHTYQGGEH